MTVQSSWLIIVIYNVRNVKRYFNVNIIYFKSYFITITSRVVNLELSYYDLY